MLFQISWELGGAGEKSEEGFLFDLLNFCLNERNVSIFMYRCDTNLRVGMELREKEKRKKKILNKQSTRLC